MAFTAVKYFTSHMRMENLSCSAWPGPNTHNDSACCMLCAALLALHAAHLVQIHVHSADRSHSACCRPPWLVWQQVKQQSICAAQGLCTALHYVHNVRMLCAAPLYSYAALSRELLLLDSRSDSAPVAALLGNEGSVFTRRPPLRSRCVLCGSWPAGGSHAAAAAD